MTKLLESAIEENNKKVENAVKDKLMAFYIQKKRIEKEIIALNKNIETVESKISKLEKAYEAGEIVEVFDIEALFTGAILSNSVIQADVKSTKLVDVRL